MISEEIKLLVAGTATEAQQWLDFFQIWTPSTADEQDVAATAMQEVHTRLQALETRRKEITGPLNKAKKEVDALFRPARDLLEQAKNALRLSLERAAAGQLQVFEAAAACGDAAQAVLPAPPTGTRFRQDFDILVVDEDLVPDQYWCLDWSALRIAAKNGEVVPGVEFRLKQSVVLTGGKK